MRWQYILFIHNTKGSSDLHMYEFDAQNYTNLTVTYDIFGVFVSITYEGVVKVVRCLRYCLKHYWNLNQRHRKCRLQLYWNIILACCAIPVSFVQLGCFSNKNLIIKWPSAEMSATDVSDTKTLKCVLNEEEQMTHRRE